MLQPAPAGRHPRFTGNRWPAPNHAMFVGTERRREPDERRRRRTRSAAERELQRRDLGYAGNAALAHRAEYAARTQHGFHQTTAKLAALLLANGGAFNFEGNFALARGLRMSLSTVKRHRRLLETNGYLTSFTLLRGCKVDGMRWGAQYDATVRDVTELRKTLVPEYPLPRRQRHEPADLTSWSSADLRDLLGRVTPEWERYTYVVEQLAKAEERERREAEKPPPVKASSFRPSVADQPRKRTRIEELHQLLELTEDEADRAQLVIQLLAAYRAAGWNEAEALQALQRRQPRTTARRPITEQRSPVVVSDEEIDRWEQDTESLEHAAERARREREPDIPN